MKRMGRTTAELVLTEEGREVLVRWSRRAKSSQALAQRSRAAGYCASILHRLSSINDEERGITRPG